MKQLPIVIYGDPILQKKSKEIEKGTLLNELVESMFYTSEHANGCGLAAPQIGKNIRLFIMDTTCYTGHQQIKTACINPIILKQSPERECATESCLSLPSLRPVSVHRSKNILVRYFDESWKLQECTLEGIAARVFLHEYDHLEGILHISYASLTQKILLQKRLSKIKNGDYTAAYPTRSYKK